MSLPFRASRCERLGFAPERGEFDEQVLALTKILVDSLNERELEGAIPQQHRKGEDYRKAAAAFGMDEKTLREVFETVLNGAIALLDALERHFLAAPAPPAA